MLTAGDDYPIHQTPEPIAYAGGERNFYDRYFFNGYNSEGSVFFAAAMGFYPQLGIADASFCLSIDGKQHNLRASKHLNGERMHLSVGPISIEIIEPLNKIKINISDNDSGITGEIIFTSRHLPIEEPRFTRRQGTRLFMDYTRMTQNGSWSGSLSKDDQTINIDPASVIGTRDRSWGIRPVGASDPQPPPGSASNLPQFFWLWAPSNFDDYACFAHSNDDGDGAPWNRRSVLAPLSGKACEADNGNITLEYVSDSRRISKAVFALSNDAQLTLLPGQFHFYMNGLGYMHPQWGHGMDHGGEAFAYDYIDLATINDADPINIHIQALSKAILEVEGQTHEGVGMLEQLLIGPHAPSGFSELLDGAA